MPRSFFPAAIWVLHIISDEHGADIDVAREFHFSGRIKSTAKACSCFQHRHTSSAIQRWHAVVGLENSALITSTRGIIRAGSRAC